MDRHNWWPQQLLIGWVNLVLSASVVYLFSSFSLMVYRDNFIIVQSVFFFIVQSILFLSVWLTALFKSVLAILIDRWHLGHNNYRNWLIILGSVYAAVLLLLAFNPPENTPYLILLMLLLLASLFAAWADVPIHALAIALLPGFQRINTGCVRAAANALGTIVGGGLAMNLIRPLNWKISFIVLSLAVVSCAGLVMLLKTPKNTEILTALPRKIGFKQWVGWFVLPQHYLWALLLLLYYPMISTIWHHIASLMVDFDISLSYVGMIFGVVGGLVSIIGSLITIPVLRYIGVYKALPLFALGNFLAIGILFIVVLFGLGKDALVIAVFPIFLMIGASGGLVFGLMLTHARDGLSALDYGIQSSLFLLGSALISLLSSMVFDWSGYSGMLGSLLLGSVLVLALAYKGSRVLTPVTDDLKIDHEIFM